MIWTEALPYFPKHELACRSTGIIKLDLRFAAALPALRMAAGRSLTPTSVCRTPAHNKASGGHPNSLHLTENPVRNTNGTMAADLAWRMWPTDEKLAFARLAWKMGWAVGLHDGFIHVDRRAEIGLPQSVFLYGTWSNAFSPEAVRS